MLALEEDLQSNAEEDVRVNAGLIIGGPSSILNNASMIADFIRSSCPYISEFTFWVFHICFFLLGFRSILYLVYNWVYYSILSSIQDFYPSFILPLLLISFFWKFRK